jgi:hypothetical protein
MSTDYAKLLEESFDEVRSYDECMETRLEFLSQKVFGFITYDGGMDALFAAKAAEVCEAINTGTTFAYIEDPERYRWYLLMCNMPFFAGRLNWGTSIRGAWWDAPHGEPHMTLDSCGLWIDGEQATQLRFSDAEWTAFIDAVVKFAKPSE